VSAQLPPWGPREAGALDPSGHVDILDSSQMHDWVGKGMSALRHGFQRMEGVLRDKPELREPCGLPTHHSNLAHWVPLVFLYVRERANAF
jgi:hypothetical protein